MIQRYWTSGEIAALKRFRQEGKSLQQIAELLGRSWDQVRGIMDRQSLTRTPEGMRRILPAVTVQHSNRDVARKFGLSEQTVRCYKVLLRRLGYDVYPSTVSPFK